MCFGLSSNAREISRLGNTRDETSVSNDPQATCDSRRRVEGDTRARTGRLTRGKRAPRFAVTGCSRAPATVVLQLARSHGTHLEDCGLDLRPGPQQAIDPRPDSGRFWTASQDGSSFRFQSDRYQAAERCSHHLPSRRERLYRLPYPPSNTRRRPQVQRSKLPTSNTTGQCELILISVGGASKQSGARQAAAAQVGPSASKRREKKSLPLALTVPRVGPPAPEIK